MSQQDQANAFNAYPVSNSNQSPITELTHPDEQSHPSYIPNVDEESDSIEDYSDLESDDDDDQSADWKSKGPSDQPIVAKNPRQQPVRSPNVSNTQASARRGTNSTPGSRNGGNEHVSQPVGYGSQANQGRSASTRKAN